MAIGRQARRRERASRVHRQFPRERADVVLDLLELVELAWHDCYNEVTPSEQVIDDILEVSQGDLAGAVRASRLAVEDFRDLRQAADALRGEDLR